MKRSLLNLFIFGFGISLVLISVNIGNMQLGFLGPAEAENEQTDNCYLNMKILGQDNEIIRDADILWLALKDGVGPTEEFNIIFKDENYSIELPGVGAYFFTINAEGYETVEKKEIKIEEKIENITIILGKRRETSSEYDVFGPVGRSDFWYPATEGDLKRMVDSFLAKASVEELEGRVVAVIAPHAGFRCSGQCAAFSFKPLIKQKFERVIILAPSHVGGFRGLSILKADYYKTPLGLIKVDVGVCESLLKERLINTIPYAHTIEHSLENMLPFLQRTLNKFKLVPIIVGKLSDEDYEMLASGIKKYIDANTLIVVSSDFTHYGPYHNYLPFPLNKDTRENIEDLDRGAIDRIVNVDLVGFQQYLAKTGATICGRVPIGLLLKILPRDAKGELVHYYMSGDFIGSYRNSVSYGSIVFHHK